MSVLYSEFKLTAAPLILRRQHATRIWYKIIIVLRYLARERKFRVDLIPRRGCSRKSFRCIFV